MINLGVKYLNEELTTDEKKLILMSVTEDEVQMKEFIEFDHLLGYLSLRPQNGDKKNAQRSLLNFLKDTDKPKDIE